MKKCLYLIFRLAGLSLCFLLLFYCHSGAQIVTTIAGNGFGGFSGDGMAATAAELDSPSCLALDGAGNLYISDQLNSRVRVVNPAGIISTFAGTNTAGYGGDGGPATIAKLDVNWGIAFDGTGNLYIADEANSCVRMVNTSGTISTFAGTTSYGYAGDGGPATLAKFSKTIGVATDAAGNVYVGDQDNYVVRKIDVTGTVTTFAGDGSPGSSGDGGPATAAKLGFVFGLATDAAGNVYICDGLNSEIRMVNTAGNIYTIAGNGISGFNGDGLQATATSLNNPTSVFIRANGEILIADCFNNRVRKVGATGVVSTIAGTGTPGFSGDNGPAVTARFNLPEYVVADADDNIYVVDWLNVRVRKISKALSFTNGHVQSMEICENTAAVSLNTKLAIKDLFNGFTATWSLVSGPYHGSAAIAYSTTTTGGTLTPTGLSYSPAVGYSGNDTLVVSAFDGSASDTTTIYITVDPLFLSAGTITGASSVCAGSSITLTDSVTGGVWSCSNTYASVVPIPFGSTVTGVVPGTDTVIYTVSNACGTVISKKKITINLTPDAGVISGPAAVCKGSAITLTDTANDGVWSSSNSLATLSPIARGCIVTGTGAGTDTIVYTVSNTLCKATTSYTVRVDTFPSAGKITGPATVCVGSQITLSDTVMGGTWNASDTAASISPSGNECTVTGVSTGPGTISYSITNSCGTNIATFPLSVGALPDIPVVSEFEGVFHAPAGYSSYQWTLNGNLIPGAITDSYAVTTPGLYSVIVTNTFGCSTNSVPEQFSGCGPDDLKVYPNPATSIANIQWCKRVTIKVMCLDGKWVKTVRNTDSIDLGELPNGSYLLSIFDLNGIRVKTKRITKISK